MPHHRTAFTLVELLVVITIIVILVSLITPALEVAINRAEQVQCAAQLDALGVGLTRGAMENARRFPQRLTRYQPIDIMDGNGDERPELRRYLGAPVTKLLNCPLSREVELDNAVATIVQTSYNLWWGWSAAVGEKMMNKVSDEWTFNKGLTRFRIVAMDYEFFASSNSTLYSGQPDRSGSLVNYYSPGGQQTTSTWAGGVARGELDYNVLYNDGSVELFDGVKPYDRDERMMIVSRGWNGSLAEWNRVPKPR